MAFRAAHPGGILQHEPTLLTRQAAQRWQEAASLHHVISAAELSTLNMEPPITTEERTRIARAHTEYEDVYCNGRGDEEAFHSVKAYLLLGVEACRIDLYTSELTAAEAWRESTRLADRLRQISDDEIEAAAARNRGPKTTVHAGLALEDHVVPTRPLRAVECFADTNISWLYTNIVAKGTSPGPYTRAYLLQEAPESAPTMDRLYWKPVNFDGSVAQLLQTGFRGRVPQFIFVSRGCEHIVAIVGEKRMQIGGQPGGVRNALLGIWAAARAVRGDSAVILFPGETPGRDLDRHIRTAADIPPSSNVHYIISDVGRDRLGRWDEKVKQPHLSPDTSNIYAVISRS